MTTSYPGAYDDFTNPSSGTQLSATGLKHHEQHANLNDAVEAIEHVLGPSTGAVTTGVLYSLTSVSGQITTLNSTVSGIGSGGAPTSGTYLTLSSLSGAAARTFTPGASLSGTDAGSGSTYTVRVYPTGVASGTYYKPTFTVNAQGQLTYASDSGAGDGFIRGLPGQPRFTTSQWFGEYVPETGRIYFTTKVVTGSLYYIDRTSDYKVLLGVISGKTPGVRIYSTILTGFVHSQTSTSGFITTATGGSLVGTSIGMDGGACIRTAVSGKTIYGNCIGNGTVTIYDPASQTQTNTAATGAGGTDGRSIAYVSGVDCVYSARRDSDISKITCSTTGVTTISGSMGGINLGSRTSLCYNAASNKVFCCGTSASANFTWYFTPSTGTESACTTLAFPAGNFTNGATACMSMGNYVYFANDSVSPSLLLCLDAVNLTWKVPLGFSENVASTANFSQGDFLTGIASEGLLYAGVNFSTSTGFVAFGRYG